jgi:hypothetical protein
VELMIAFPDGWRVAVHMVQRVGIEVQLPSGFKKK